MHRIAVSIFALLTVFPAVADVRLPVVNIASAGVSARAAFGENVTVAPLAKPVDTPVAVAKPVAKKVVARTTVAARPVQKTSVDSGAQIVASNDILTPQRPSADLWARVDTPLRMPSASEFSVIRSDYDLPEESLDAKPVRPVVARAVEPVAPLSQLDAQIAHLNELQRRADASVERRNVEPVVVDAPRVAAASRNAIVARPLVPTPVAETPSVAKNIEPKTVENEPRVARMIVPDEPDVVVRSVEKSPANKVAPAPTSARIASVREDMTKMSPTELRRAFRKTFLSENKHLSTYPIDSRFDVASDVSTSMGGFTSQRDLSESGGIRPLEIKINFRNDDSALSRDNYQLLTEYAGIISSNPTRAIQVSIPESATYNKDDRKMAARRLAIVEQVLRDNGISEHRIMPVLAQRSDDSFVLRMISAEQYETMTQQRRNMFGDTVNKKSYKSMSW